MDLSGKGIVLLLAAMILIGVYAWFERDRTLSCRADAAARGVSVVEAIKFCKH